MEKVEAEGTACHYYDRGSYVVASRRRSGGSAWGPSRQRVPPVTTATGGRTSWHRATGRVAVHGEHRGRGYYLSSLRQGVVHRSIAPPGGRQRMENIEADGTACHHYDRGSYVVASCRRSGGSAWITSRQRVLPVITTTGARTSWHRAAGRVAAHGEHRGRGYCLSSLRQGVVRRVIVPPVGWQRVETSLMR